MINSERRETRTDARGNAYESRGKWYVRISLGGGKRVSKLLPQLTTKADADKRAEIIASLVRELRDASRHPRDARSRGSCIA